MTDNVTNKQLSRLEGRIAQLLNERELVINIGSEAGVKQGMKFAVMSESPLEIRDPITHEVLDSVDREKVRVEAHEVRPKISICRTYRVRYTEGLQLAMPFLRPAREIPETLRADDASFPPPLDPAESYVKINDRVIFVQD
jgi:hypothetical protein